MPEFTVTGFVAGDTAVVTWRDDGTIEGDQLPVFEALAVARTGAPVAIPGVFAGPASLDEHLPALATVLSIFDNVPYPTVEGDEPAVEDLGGPQDGDPDPDAPEGVDGRLIVLD